MEFPGCLETTMANKYVLVAALVILVALPLSSATFLRVEAPVQDKTASVENALFDKILAEQEEEATREVVVGEAKAEEEAVRNGTGATGSSTGATGWSLRVCRGKAPRARSFSCFISCVLRFSSPPRRISA